MESEQICPQLAASLRSSGRLQPREGQAAARRYRLSRNDLISATDSRSSHDGSTRGSSAPRAVAGTTGSSPRTAPRLPALPGPEWRTSASKSYSTTSPADFNWPLRHFYLFCHHRNTRNARNVFQRLGSPAISKSKKNFAGKALREELAPVVYGALPRQQWRPRGASRGAFASRNQSRPCRTS